MAIATRHITNRAVTNAKLGIDSIAKNKYVFDDFRDDVVAVKRLGAGAATGTAGDRNIMMTRAALYEYHIKGTQTILGPVKTAVGLDISLDQTDNDGVEYTHGILARGQTAYTLGTDGAVTFRVKMKIADVSGTDDLLVGFRKAEAYQASVDDYDEMAALNVILGDIKIETILNNAATTTTDTTNDWADAATKTLTVKIAAARTVTYQIDGAAPLVTAAFTFDSGEVVVPFLFFLQATTSPGIVELIEWECGLDAEA